MSPVSTDVSPLDSGVDPERVRAFGEAVRERLSTVIFGHTDGIEGVLIALLAPGHVLIEGVPGVGKTLLVRALAKILDLPSQRVQFTAETLPSDVIGSLVFDPRSGAFAIRKGPVFTGLLLADELNRAPPRTQAALLEVMEERRVTLDGEPQPVDPSFTVLATQNPLEPQGTWPLPDAELDRFLLCLKLEYPDASSERALLNRAVAGLNEGSVRELASVDADLLALRTVVRQVSLTEPVREDLLALVQQVRAHPDVIQGPSPRALLGLLRACQARAALDGRAYVTPQDTRALAGPALAHRLVLAPAARIQARSAQDVVQAVSRGLIVPR